jgi:hypothetical protein
MHGTAQPRTVGIGKRWRKVLPFRWESIPQREQFVRIKAILVATEGIKELNRERRAIRPKWKPRNPIRRIILRKGRNQIHGNKNSPMHSKIDNIRCGKLDQRGARCADDRQSVNRLMSVEIDQRDFGGAQKVEVGWEKRKDIDLDSRGGLQDFKSDREITEKLFFRNTQTSHHINFKDGGVGGWAMPRFGGGTRDH